MTAHWEMETGDDVWKFWTNWLDWSNADRIRLLVQAKPFLRCRNKIQKTHQHPCYNAKKNKISCQFWATSPGWPTHDCYIFFPTDLQVGKNDANRKNLIRTIGPVLGRREALRPKLFPDAAQIKCPRRWYPTPNSSGCSSLNSCYDGWFAARCAACHVT